MCTRSWELFGRGSGASVCPGWGVAEVGWLWARVPQTPSPSVCTFVGRALEGRMKASCV